jgi:hypothetical protein
MARGTLANAQPGQPVAVRFRNGSMHCMMKVPNPSGRTRYKGKFVCNSACGLPAKHPSRACGGVGQVQQQRSQQSFLGGY